MLKFIIVCICRDAYLVMHAWRVDKEFVLHVNRSHLAPDFMWLLFVAYFTVYWFHVEWTISASNLNHLQGTSNGSVSAQVQDALLYVLVILAQLPVPCLS